MTRFTSSETTVVNLARTFDGTTGNCVAKVDAVCAITTRSTWGSTPKPPAKKTPAPYKPKQKSPSTKAPTPAPHTSHPAYNSKPKGQEKAETMAEAQHKYKPKSKAPAKKATPKPQHKPEHEGYMRAGGHPTKKTVGAKQYRPYH
ncbi:uncharacterized protein IUM83_09572 [Phytophthora cinnamomi]|uniref:uncharacterized protein n=1 Tax=Phytophthora cinnamomi TaxID=4785 RepID=UPI00355A39D4|nr:hypothetical protein IUM83_09572 [Phytophthora cinnamomi]